MSTAKSQSRNVPKQSDGSKEIESPREIGQDIVNYLTDYAKENPGYAALACIGVGFILGWKLKPW